MVQNVFKANNFHQQQLCLHPKQAVKLLLQNWGKLYGDVIHHHLHKNDWMDARLFSQPLVVLSL